MTMMCDYDKDDDNDDDEGGREGGGGGRNMFSEIILKATKRYSNPCNKCSLSIYTPIDLGFFIVVTNS